MEDIENHTDTQSVVINMEEILRNREEIKRRENGYLYDCISTPLFRFIIGVSIFIFPIIQVIYGILYINSVDCNSFVDVSTWLIVNGCSGVFNGILFIITAYLSTKESKNIVGIMILIVINIFFMIVWLIIGSIMFWRDCEKDTPKHINTLMWITLILELFATSQIILNTNRK